MAVTETPTFPTPQIEFKRKPRRAGKLARLAILGTLAATVGGAGYYAVQTVQQQERQDFLAQVGKIDKSTISIPEVPLNEVTKKSGVTAIRSSGIAPNENFPEAFSIFLLHETIVAIEPDDKENSVWIALALPGDKLTKTETGQVVTNLDGTKQKLAEYEGFTAWVKLTSDTRLLKDGNGASIMGFEHILPLLKVGKQISATVTLGKPNQDNRYNDMTRNTMGLLDANIGKPNDRNDKQFKFKADIIIANTN